MLMSFVKDSESWLCSSSTWPLGFSLSLRDDLKFKPKVNKNWQLKPNFIYSNEYFSLEAFKWWQLIRIFFNRFSKKKLFNNFKYPITIWILKQKKDIYGLNVFLLILPFSFVVLLNSDSQETARQDNWNYIIVKEKVSRKVF